MIKDRLGHPFIGTTIVRLRSTPSVIALLMLLFVTLVIDQVSAGDLSSSYRDCRTANDPAVKRLACSNVLSESRDKRQRERAFNSRGLANMTLKDYRAALTDFDNAVAFDKSNSGYIDNRGSAHFALGQYDRALADAEKTVAMSSKFAFGYASRGRAHRELGSFDAAIRDFSVAISLDPTWLDLLLERAATHERSGNVALAAADYAKAIDQKPDFWWAYRQRGMFWWRIGAKEKALHDLEAAKTSMPDDVELTSTISAIYRSRPSPSISASPQPTFATTTDLPSTAERRVALILGNSQYKFAPPLANPRNDSEALSAALNRLGFNSVVVRNDLTREATINSLREFAVAADSADWAVVYYSGHGIELGGANYLIPIDARLQVDRDIDLEAVDVGKILSSIEGAKGLRLVVLDACRDNPFASQMRRTMASRSIGRGLARIEPEAGTLIAYSAKHGEVAYDGQGQNSPFVSSVLQRIMTPGLEVRRLFDLVRDDVMASTRGKQQPFTYGSLSGSRDYFFIRR